MIFVVSSIFTFVGYYMGSDVSSENFKLLKVLFLGLIIFMLTSFGVVIFIGWEGIGIMSMCLIGYWIRPMAKSGAISAMIYNRWGDLVFLGMLFMNGESFSLLVIFAILCKSSLYLWQYWLPVAMERPTPVSSLLHSSTMVVARVYLMMLIPHSVPIVVVVLLLAVSMVRHMDVKKNIAYSTSIHLVLIVLLSVGGFYSVVVLYIILHRIVKRQLFQSSGYEIHGVGSQDMRKFNMNGSSLLMLVAMFMLSALVRIVILRSKEVVVLGLMRVVVVVMVCVSMLYTLVYANKLSIGIKVGESEGLYVLGLILLSIILIEVNFGVWLSLIVFGVVIMMFYGNSIVTVV